MLLKSDGVASSLKPASSTHLTHFSVQYFCQEYQQGNKQQNVSLREPILHGSLADTTGFDHQAMAGLIFAEDLTTIDHDQPG